MLSGVSILKGVWYMEITKVIIRQIINDNDSTRVLALASVILEDVLMLHDMSLIEGRERWFLSFPGKLRGSGRYADFYYPMDNAFRTKMENAVIAAYLETKQEIERKEQV